MEYFELIAHPPLSHQKQPVHAVAVIGHLPLLHCGHPKREARDSQQKSAWPLLISSDALQMSDP